MSADTVTHENVKLPRTMRILLTVTALIVIVAGMRAARDLVVPLLFAAFISILCLPVLAWLKRRRVPSGLAVLMITVTILVVGAGLAGLVGMSVNEFVKALPEYQSRMDTETASLLEWLKSHNIEISKQVIVDYFAPHKAMSMTENVVSGLGALLSSGVVVLFIVGFFLLEASGFPDKLRLALTNSDYVLDGFREFGKAVQRYIINKTLTSAVSGLAIFLFLVIIGVDYPLLWGLVAFLLNFVPYVGSTLASVPPVLLAMVQFGIGPAIWTAVGCVCINTIEGILEPRVLAGGVGLSALIVFLSLVVWGWVLGPIGAILSVPLTIIVKIGLESHADSRWIATMLGPSPGKRAHGNEKAASAA